LANWRIVGVRSRAQADVHGWEPGGGLISESTSGASTGGAAEVAGADDVTGAGDDGAAGEDGAAADDGGKPGLEALGAAASDPTVPWPVTVELHAAAASSASVTTPIRSTVTP